MILQAEALHCFRDGKAVLDGLSLQLAAGEVLGIIGPNGAGKSSLLMALACLLPPASGRLVLEGQNPLRLAPQARARRLGYLPQQPSLAWPLTVRELVHQGRFPHPANPEADARAIDFALARTGLAAMAEKILTTLSGGEQARAHLARLLAGEHAVLLCDEPVAALDPYHQLAFLALLQTLAREGRAVAVILHDLPLAARWCDRLLVLKEGRAVASGTPAAILTDELLGKVFRVRGARDPQGHLLSLAPLD